MPLLGGVVSVGIAIGLLVLAGAPRDLLALEAAMAVGLGLTLLDPGLENLDSRRRGRRALVILLLVFGPGALVLVPAVMLVAWARVVVHDHTFAQTVAGAALGACVAAAVFSVLRA